MRIIRRWRPKVKKCQGVGGAGAKPKQGILKLGRDRLEDQKFHAFLTIILDIVTINLLLYLLL